MPILIPVSLRRLGAHLFDQQMWLWGQDIRHPESNALLRYGFQRHPSPDPRKAGSAYTWQDDRTHFVLWSFGLFAGQAHLGGLFLKRFQFAPRLSDDSQLKTIVWEPSALPRLDIPDPGDSSTLAHLLHTTLLWIADYELWAQQQFTLRYRQQCVASWHKTQIPAEAIVTSWRKLAADLLACLQVKSRRF